MLLVELIPTLHSLSRSDKFRLIQFLVADLARDGDTLLSPAKRMGVERGENGRSEEEQIEESVHAVGLRNALGLLEEEGLRIAGEGSARNLDPATPSGASESYPYWSPDQESEAATVLMRMLEAEKSAS